MQEILHGYIAAVEYLSVSIESGNNHLAVSFANL